MSVDSSDAKDLRGFGTVLKPQKMPSPKRVQSRGGSKKRSGGQWVMSADVPTDVIVEAAGANFSLHKFPLVTRSGRCRKLVAESKNSDVTRMEFPDIPGGPEIFELAIKFCYGIPIEITISNVAGLYCVADYLLMTEDYAENNLRSQAEKFLDEIVGQNFANALVVLHSCQNLLPMAEKLGIVSRSVDTIALRACRDEAAKSLSNARVPSGAAVMTKSSMDAKTLPTAWWAEDLCMLRVDFFQQVLNAMKCNGMSNESLWSTIIFYAQSSLEGFSKKHGSNEGLSSAIEDNNLALEYEQRIFVETIVSLLPKVNSAASCNFLFGLLRTAIILDTTIACRLDVERRIGMQLESATLDDLLIPSFSYSGDTLFDIDIVHRMFTTYIESQENEDSYDPQSVFNPDGIGSPPPIGIRKVAKLLEGYLAEIAPDANLKLNKFIALAELIPAHARPTDDGIYRAIDIYLKAHPNSSEQERKRLTKLMNPQKLSPEACHHAAQNERLPAHFMVQVLYSEQMRLRAEMENPFVDGENGGHYSGRSWSGNNSALMSPQNYASLRHENRELKSEIARMRTRLSELEKSHLSMKQEVEKTTGSNKVMNSVSKRMTKLNSFLRRNSKDSDNGNTKKPESGNLQKSRQRRHSYS